MTGSAAPMSSPPRARFGARDRRLRPQRPPDARRLMAPPARAARRNSPRRRRPRVLRDRFDRTHAAAQATLDKQAAWLNQYGRYTFTIEGHADERGTREYNFALGARRAETHQELPDRQGRLGLADEDDQLRQGASGRGLRRHFLLVAEPPRGHGARGRRGKLTPPPARASPQFWPPPPYGMAGARLAQPDARRGSEWRNGCRSWDLR